MACGSVPSIIRSISKDAMMRIDNVDVCSPCNVKVLHARQIHHDHHFKGFVLELCVA